MTGCLFGRDSAEVERKLRERDRTADALRGIGVAVGTGNEIVAQLGEWASTGVGRIMLQWLDLDDLDGLEAMAKSVLPQIA